MDRLKQPLRTSSYTSSVVDESVPLSPRQTGPLESQLDDASSEYFANDVDPSSTTPLTAKLPKERLPYFAGLDDIERAFGVGNRLLFNFYFFVIFACSILSVVGLIEWIVFLMTPNRTNIGSWENFFVSSFMRPQNDVLWVVSCIIMFLLFFFLPLSYFFVSSFMRPQNDVLWVVSCIIMFLLFFFLPLSYFFWERFFSKAMDRPLEEQDAEDADHIVIAENRQLTARYRLGWRILVAVLFVVACTIGTVLLYCMNLAENALLNAARSRRVTLTVAELATIISLLSGVLLSLLCVIWTPINGVLTRLEYHTHWSHFRLSQAAKLLGFRIVLLVAMFVLSSKVLLVQLSISGGIAECTMLDIGGRILIILISDFLMSNGLALLFAAIAVWLRRKLWRFKFMRPRGGVFEDDESLRAEFNISNQILATLYRVLLTYLGSLLLPTIAFVSVACFIAEIFVCRALMLRLCKRPHFMESKLGKFMAFWMLAIAFVALIFYPNGVLFMVFAPSSLPPNFRNCTMYKAIQRI